jgi:flagellar biosynthesis/type III secretory pathway chaperone
MTVTVLPPDGAHRHQSQRRSQEVENLEPAQPLLKPQGGGVRILRTPEELSEAINRVREFEQRNAEAMRIRAERHKSALGVLEHTTIQLNFEIDDSSDNA